MDKISIDKIETGDVILVDSSGILPDSIEWFQGNRFNHAAIAVRSLTNKLYVNEFVNRGGQFTKFDKYYKEYIDNKIDLIILKPVVNFFNKKDYNKFIDFLYDHNEDRYEFENLLIWQAIKYLSKKIFNHEIWIGKKTDNTYICGEWVAKCYNYMLDSFENWEKLAPVDLYNSTLFLKYKLKK